MDKALMTEFKEVLDLLTHKKEDSYEEYILKIKENEMATYIKKCDMTHNLQRMLGLEPDEIIRRSTKYVNAFHLLGVKTK